MFDPTMLVEDTFRKKEHINEAQRKSIKSSS